MADANERPIDPTRRDFLRGSVPGVICLGLGMLSGWVKGAAAAKSSPAAPGGRVSATPTSLGGAYDYDLSRLREVDSKLLLYNEVDTYKTGLKELRALAVGANRNLYAAGSRSVVVLSPEGQRLATWSLEDAPRCLATDSRGKVYVGFRDRIGVLAEGGSLVQSWPIPGKQALLASIAVSASDVFAADAGQRVVHRFSLEGRPVAQIGKKDKAKGVPGFVVPSPYLEVSVGKDGFLWVANPGRHRIEAYTFDGEFVTGWGEPSNGIEGFCGCCNPVHFARLSDGRFVTSEKGLPRIKVYSSRGDFEGVVAAPAKFPSLVDHPNATQTGLDVAVTHDDRVLVADALTGEVRVFTAKPKLN